MLLTSPRSMCNGRLSLLLGVNFFWIACGTMTLRAGDLGFSAEPFEVWHDEGSWWLHDSVTAIVQTHDGYVWLGTYHGLVRFNGLNFTVFDSGNAPELPNGRITSLYESPDRVLWIGHETGQLSRIAAGEFQSIKLGTSWPGGVVEAISSDEEGNVWLLNDSGVLYRVLDGLTNSTPGGASALRKATLARAQDGKLWMASNGQVATLEHGKVAPFGFPADPANALVERVFPAADEGIWVLGAGKLRKWRKGDWRETIEAVPSLPGSIGVVAETRYGLLAGAMRTGLYLLRPGAAPLHFTRADGLSHDWVRALCMDQEGNCWIGTGAGFDGLRSRKVRMVAPADGWRGCTVRSFQVEPDEAWVGTEGAGLYHYEGGQWSAFNEQNGLLSVFVWSVLKTEAQGLFVGTWGGGLYQRTGDRFERRGELGKLNAPVAALYEGRGGELWIGTQEGLYRYHEGKLTWLAGKEQLALPDIRTITESPDGTLWFGMSGGGLGSIVGGAVQQFRKADGLSSDVVTCLYADTDGSLWVGTSDNGLTRLKAGEFSIVNSERGLLAKGVSHIVDDGAGYLWLGSLNGIWRVNKADLNLCADGKSESVHCLNYGRAEGLTTQICTSGFQPGACKSADGQLWFPTIKGLAVLDPARVTSNSVPPPVAIEALLVDGNLVGAREAGKSADSPGASSGPPGARRPIASSEFPGLAFYPGGAPIRITPGRHRFEVRYVGLSFVAPEKVRYSRMLEGLENEWVDVGAKRSAEYQYLPPGQYNFRVIACNNDGVWNREGASLAFAVMPFIWQTLGFRIGSIAGGAGVLAAGVFWAGRRRLRRQLEISERQHAVERERGRIARDMHDELGASLTRISLLSESVRGETSGQPQVAEEADQIHSTAREVIRAMDEIVWAVNPAYDTLDSLVAYLGRYAERYLDAVAIRCRLDVPVHVPRQTLSAEVRHNVFLAFKEALHNVVKHAHATEVRISIELSANGFVVLVADNGSGFDLNGVEKPQSTAPDSDRLASGNGLANMRKRMDEIGGTCAWETGPGRGTRLKLAVAIKV